MNDRVVSLVPSLTEFIIRLGYPIEKIVGRTVYCIHPSDQVQRIPTLGGTKKINMKKFKSFTPDLVIMNKEENSLEMYQEIAELIGEKNIILTEIESIKDALIELKRIAKRLHLDDPFHNFEMSFYSRIKKVQDKLSGKALYFIWKDPWMVAGNHTFIHSWLELLGLENVGQKMNGRYPQIKINTVKEMDLDWIFLSSEPFHFSENEQKYLSTTVGGSSKTKIVLVDGSYFIWYGYRMLDAIDYFQKIFDIP